MPAPARPLPRYVNRGNVARTIWTGTFIPGDSRRWRGGNREIDLASFYATQNARDSAFIQIEMYNYAIQYNDQLERYDVVFGIIPTSSSGTPYS